MGYVGKVTAGGSTHLVASTLYGTCDTAAATAAKVVTCSDFNKLLTGVTIHVKFTNTNTATNPTLNVNSTGAKNIYRYGSTVPGTDYATSWYDGAIISFTYDGTSWIMNDWLNTDTNTTYTFANGTNGFTVTPSGGSAQTVTVTPSITNNVTGSGTSGYIAKFNGTNTITNGPAFGSSTTTFLRNDGTWATPTGSVTSVAGKTGAVTLSASDVGALASTTTYAGSATVGGQATKTCLYTSRQTSANLTATGVPGVSHFVASSSMTTGKPTGDAHILHMSWDNTGGYDSQLAVTHGGGYHMEIRSQNGGTWQNWKTVLDSSNYSTYALGKNATATAALKLTTNAGQGGGKKANDTPDIPVYFSNGVPVACKARFWTGYLAGSGANVTLHCAYGKVMIWRNSSLYWEGYVDQWGNAWAKNGSSNVSLTVPSTASTIKITNNGSYYVQYIVIGCAAAES